MKFYYNCFTTDSKEKCINIKLKDEQNITFILLNVLKSIHPIEEIRTPFEEKFNDIWELDVQSDIGYFGVKIELPYDDVWINGPEEIMKAIDLLLQKDDRFEKLNTRF